MKKRYLAKTTLCCGAVLAVIASTNVAKASSATYCAEKGLAGISITLDKYCATEDPTDVVTLDDVQVPGSSVVTGAALEEKSEFDNIGISVANNYVNIRKEASTDGEVIGKLYKGSAATILEDNGEWVKIESGRCKGYINSEFLATGLKAEELADTYGKKQATVTTTTLKVREKADAESTCLTLIPNGETYEVTREDENWVKISIDDGDIKGFVSKEYVDVEVKFEKAISIEEEQEKLRREEDARRAAEEAAAAARAEEEAAAAARAASSSSNSSSSSTTKKSSSGGSSNGGTVKGTGTGAQVAQYALQFVGNPYVWGGESLTNGADCSGFTMSVYRHFGVSLPHSSASQSTMGTKVSLSEAQAGDLVFYAGSSGVSHVALYIGGGKIVHAKGKDYGIVTSSVNYRSVYCVKRILK